MRFKRIFLYSICAAVTGVIGASVYAKHLIDTEYKNGISILNELDGVTAKQVISRATDQDTERQSTLIILDNKFSFGLNELPANNKISIVVDHEINYWTYPFEIQYKFNLLKESSKLLSRALNIEEPADGLEIPVQLISLHKLNGDFSFIGLVDALQLDRQLSLSPIPFQFYKADGQAYTFNASVERAKLNSTTILQNVNLDNFSFHWKGSLDECGAICPSEQNFIMDSVTAYDATGNKILDAEDFRFGSKVDVINNNYDFTFSSNAKTIQSINVNWSALTLESSIRDVDADVLNQFNNKLLDSSSQSLLYTQLLENGMTVNIDEFTAHTTSGDMSLSMNIKLPPDNMPNMQSNPLGAISVIQGQLTASVPMIEIDRLFGMGASNIVYQSGFALVDKQSGLMNTVIKVAGGNMEVNGKHVPL